MKYGIVLGLLAIFAAGTLKAEGVPSNGKLNKLGLGSMEIVSDQAGEQVRGKAFFKVIGTWNAAAGEKATLAADGTITIDPTVFNAHDTNNGAFVVENGLPLTTGSFGALFTSPFNVQNTATANHEQVVLSPDGSQAFSEISSSTNTFSFTIFSPFVAPVTQ